MFFLILTSSFRHFFRKVLLGVFSYHWNHTHTHIDHKLYHSFAYAFHFICIDNILRCVHINKVHIIFQYRRPPPQRTCSLCLSDSFITIQFQLQLISFDFVDFVVAVGTVEEIRKCMNCCMAVLYASSSFVIYFPLIHIIHCYHQHILNSRIYV